MVRRKTKQVGVGWAAFLRGALRVGLATKMNKVILEQWLQGVDKWGNCDTIKKDSKCQDPRTADCLASVWLEGTGQGERARWGQRRQRQDFRGPCRPCRAWSLLGVTWEPLRMSSREGKWLDSVFKRINGAALLRTEWSGAGREAYRGDCYNLRKRCWWPTPGSGGGYGDATYVLRVMLTGFPDSMGST